MPRLYWSKERFDRAKKRGGFTNAEVNKAASWTTCACGQQDDGIPRDDHDIPKDNRLAQLGIWFYNCVVGDSPEQAQGILKQIEERAALVLRNLTKEAR